MNKPKHTPSHTTLTTTRRKKHRRTTLTIHINLTTLALLTTCLLAHIHGTPIPWLLP